MATTITQRISLEGADDIQKKLQDLGKAGQAAFKQIQDAAAKPITDPAQLERTRQALVNIGQAAQQAGNAMQKAGQQAQVAGEQAGSGLKTAAVAFSVAAVGVATAIAAIARSLVSGAGETAQKIQDQADKLGLTIEQWIQLRRAMQAAGTSADEFANSTAPLFQQLNQLMVESGKSFQTFKNEEDEAVTVVTLGFGKLSAQSQQLQATLNKLGVRRDIIDQGSMAVMRELARIIDGMPEGTQKAITGVQLFGAKWRDVVSSLTQAGDSMDNMLRASREMTPEERAAAQGAKDAWEDLGRAISAAKDKVGAFLAPVSAARAKWLADLVDQARLLLSTWSQLDEAGRKSFLAAPDTGPAETVFKALIGVSQLLGSIWTNVLVPAGKEILNVLRSLAMSFNDVKVVVSSANQAIAQGPQTPWASKIVEGGKQVVDVFRQIGTVLASLYNALGFVSRFMNALFGTNFSAAGLAAILVIGQMTGALGLLATTAKLTNYSIAALSNTFGLLAHSLQIVAALVTIFGGFWAAVIIAAIIIAEEFYRKWDDIKALLTDDFTNIGIAWNNLIAALKSGWDAVMSAIGAGWDAFTSAGATAIKYVGDWVDWLIGKFKEAASWAGKVFTGGVGGGVPPDTSGGGHAAGGLIGGRGTGTSDSNLAWVSRGEHIMPAVAVAQPGVLAFLEALRASGGDLRGVMDRLGRFATGGLVTMPALSGGGPNLGTLTLGLPSGGSVSVRASIDVVDVLRREAAMAQVRSGGRKPSRYT